jgi:hypothetical protein
MEQRLPRNIEDLNPWARWGVSPSRHEGYPALTETGLWFLELRHPETVERQGSEIFVTLDRTYRAVPVPNRSYFQLVPAPFHTRAK